MKSPVALTIAGSDSGGEAGIQADLKTFAALDVRGMSAITCITAQSFRSIRAIHPCTAALVRAQLEAVFETNKPLAVKTGMLYSGSIIRAVTKFLADYQIPLVVDPVMVSTSGVALVQSKALGVLRRRLLPAATLMTPNLPEAEILADASINSVEGLRRAARRLYGLFGCAALVKGGHLRGLKEAVDILYDGKDEWLLSAPFIRCGHTHGTGCTYSAAITAFLARGDSLVRAVAHAKQYITQAIASSSTISGRRLLEHFCKPGKRKAPSRLT